MKVFFKFIILTHFVFLFILGGFNYSFATDFALSFDGTNDYVEVPFDASMNPAGDYSVNSWVKVSDLPNQWQSVVTSRSNNGTDTVGGYMLYIEPSGQGSDWNYWTGKGNTWTKAASTVDPNLDTWQMMTTTFNNESKTMKLYVDGVLLRTKANSGSLPIQIDKPLRMAAGVTENNNPQYYLNGKIDEVAIWSAELSVDEIIQLYNSGETLYAADNYGDYNSSSSLTAYWTMDNTTETSNGSGTTLFGEKNDNDGTLTNGPTWSTDVPGTLPTLLSSNPADNETDVAFDANITLTFSEIVKAGTGNIVLYKESDDSVVQTFNVATDVSGSGTTELSINPSSDLEQGVEYYVLIDSTSVVDLSRNSYVGISNSTALSFTTGFRTADPFDDKEIQAIVETQTAAPKKVVSHVTTPVFNRLNWIRNHETDKNLSKQNIELNFLNPKLKKLITLVPEAVKFNKSSNKYSEDWLYWSEGSISVGKVEGTANSSSKDISTNALTFGLDKRINDKTIQGYTFTYTKEDVEVGSSGNSVDIDSYSVSTYTTLFKDENKYLESIFGLSKLNLKSVRKSGSNTLTGDRVGDQIFGSLQYLNTIKKKKINISPNVKVNLSYTTLDGYTEKGTSPISYDNQKVETIGLYGGFNLDNEILKNNYSLRLSASFELGLDLSPNTDVSLNYVSNPNTKYTKSIDQQDEKSIKGKIGFDILTKSGWSLMTFYERNQTENSHSNTIYLLTGYVSPKEEEYAMALSDNEVSLEYKRNTNGFDVKLGSNYNLVSKIPDYSATIKVSKKF